MSITDKLVQNGGRHLVWFLLFVLLILNMFKDTFIGKIVLESENGGGFFRAILSNVDFYLALLAMIAIYSRFRNFKLVLIGGVLVYILVRVLLPFV